MLHIEWMSTIECNQCICATMSQVTKGFICADLVFASVEVQAYAESSIQDLRTQLKAKDDRIKDLQAHLQMDRQTYLAQHNVDQKEIENLKKKLLDDRNGTIVCLRVGLVYSSSYKFCSMLCFQIQLLGCNRRIP